MVAIAARTGSIVLRPVQQRAWLASVVSMLAIGVPPYTVAIVLSRGSGRIEPSIVAIGALASAAILLGYCFARAGILMNDDGVTDYGVRLVGRHTPASRIRSAIIVRVYDAVSLRTWTQLFLVDEAGSTVLRLRGRYWNDEQILVVADRFGVPVEQHDKAVTLKELRRTRGKQLYWFERHPIASSTLAAVGGLAAAWAIAATSAITIG